MIRYTTTAEPAVEPVSVSEAKLWSRIETDADDALVASLITSARATAEIHTQRRFITQTVVARLDSFPHHIVLGQTPLQSVASITYVDPLGVTQTLASSVYTVDTFSRLARIVPAPSEAWPSIISTPNAITITYQAGYGDDADDVPEPIRTAIKMIFGAAYDSRQDVVVGRGYSALRVPETSRRLLSPYRTHTF